MLDYGKRLKELQTIYKYTQKKMAYILSCTPLEIRRIEHGKSEPNAELKKKIVALSLINGLEVPEEDMPADYVASKEKDK